MTDESTPDKCPDCRGIGEAEEFCTRCNGTGKAPETGQSACAVCSPGWPCDNYPDCSDGSASDDLPPETGQPEPSEGIQRYGITGAWHKGKYVLYTDHLEDRRKLEAQVVNANEIADEARLEAEQTADEWKEQALKGDERIAELNATLENETKQHEETMESFRLSRRIMKGRIETLRQELNREILRREPADDLADAVERHYDSFGGAPGTDELHAALTAYREADEKPAEPKAKRPNPCPKCGQRIRKPGEVVIGCDCDYWEADNER